MKKLLLILLAISLVACSSVYGDDRPKGKVTDKITTLQPNEGTTYAVELTVGEHGVWYRVNAYVYGKIEVGECYFIGSDGSKDAYNTLEVCP